MKKISICIAAIFLFAQSHASAPHVYATGDSMGSSGGHAGYWLDGVWNALPELDGGITSTATSISLSNGHVYIGGSNWSPNGYIPGYWMDGVWNGLDTGDNNSWSETYAIKVVNEHVYTGGYVTLDGSDNDAPLAASWIDGVLMQLTPANPVNFSYVLTLDIDQNGHVYAGGFLDTNYYESVDPGAHRPGYWVDGVWNELPMLDETQFSQVNSLQLSNGHVYAGGFSNTNINDSPISVPGYWLDGVWNSLPVSDSKCSAVVNSISVSNNHIYAAGNDCYTPVYWIDGVSTALPNTEGYGVVNSLSVTDDGHVYAGGTISDSDSNSTPGYWLDGTWIELELPSTSEGGSLSGMILGKLSTY